MDSLCITPATAADVPGLAALLVGQDAVPDAIAAAERGLHYALEHPERGEVLVLRNGHILLGLVSLFQTVSTAEGGSVALIQDLVISPDNRRRGYGKMLLRHAIMEARARGLRRITLAADSLPPETRQFLKQYGFVDSGMIPLRHAFPPQKASATAA